MGEIETSEGRDGNTTRPRANAAVLSGRPKRRPRDAVREGGGALVMADHESGRGEGDACAATAGAAAAHFVKWNFGTEEVSNRSAERPSRGPLPSIRCDHVRDRLFYLQC